MKQQLLLIVNLLEQLTKELKVMAEIMKRAERP